MGQEKAGYEEQAKPILRALYDAIQNYFYVLHDSMDNKVIEDLGTEFLQNQFEEKKHSIINKITELEKIIGEQEALSLAKNKWDELLFQLETDFRDRDKHFILINNDFEKIIENKF